jgi:hypothetical protein
MMAVFIYAGTRVNREDHEESGTVVAQNEAEAKHKLSGLNLGNVRLKRLGRFAGLFKKLTADVK